MLGSLLLALVLRGFQSEAAPAGRLVPGRAIGDSEFLSLGTPVTAVAVSPDGTQIAAAEQDGGLTIWNKASGVRIRHGASGHALLVTSIVFLDETTLATLGADEKILLRSTQPGNGVPKEIRLRPGQGLPSVILNLPLLHETLRDTFYCGGWQLMAVGLKSGRVERTFQGEPPPGAGHPQSVTAMAVLREGTRLYSAGGNVIEWDTTTGRPLRTLAAADGPVTCLAASGDGSQLLGGLRTGGVVEWDLSGNTLQVLLGKASPELPLLALAVGPASVAAAFADGSILHLKEGKVISRSATGLRSVSCAVPIAGGAGFLLGEGPWMGGPAGSARYRVLPWDPGGRRP